MRQRVAVVRTFLKNPEMRLLDEQFSELDSLTKLELADLVSKLLKTYQTTAVIVTHDISDAITMIDRILVMGANPGTIAKTFEVPLELRNEKSFLVRRHPKYQILFDKVWDELNKYESTSLRATEVS